MESLSDIETELRTLSQSSKYCELQPTVSGKPISFYFAEIADRIDAAWKREHAKVEADALFVGGIIEAARTTEKSSAVGNVAAMLEALEDVLEKIDRWRTDGVMEHWQYSQLFDMADSALSAPARNCDLARDWLQDLYCKFKPPATVRREMPPEWVDAVMAFCKWLLAPAAERKGEGDEQK